MEIILSLTELKGNNFTEWSRGRNICIPATNILYFEDAYEIDNDILNNVEKIKDESIRLSIQRGSSCIGTHIVLKTPNSNKNIDLYVVDAATSIRCDLTR